MTSITSHTDEVDENLCSMLVRDTLAELKRAVLSALSLVGAVEVQCYVYTVSKIQNILSLGWRSARAPLLLVFLSLTPNSSHSNSLI